jgi:hypothetical protein
MRDRRGARKTRSHGDPCDATGHAMHRVAHMMRSYRNGEAASA